MIAAKTAGAPARACSALALDDEAEVLTYAEFFEAAEQVPAQLSASDHRPRYREKCSITWTWISPTRPPRMPPTAIISTSSSLNTGRRIASYCS